MEPITIGTGLAVLGSKDLLNRLLGPTADYLGGEMRNFVERCNVNLDNVFAAAIRKLGDKVSEPGVVNPRILKHVVDEGRFCEDVVVAEYLGGVLASSRTADGRDDRGLSFLTDIKSLSSYQLRTHFLIYSAIIRHGQERNTNSQNWYGKKNGITLVFDDDSFANAMEYGGNEAHYVIARQALLGLEAKDLCQGGTDCLAGADKGSQGFKVPFRFIWPTPYGN